LENGSAFAAYSSCSVELLPVVSNRNVSIPISIQLWQVAPKRHSGD